MRKAIVAHSPVRIIGVAITKVSERPAALVIDALTIEL
jgi:hypothetical protein